MRLMLVEDSPKMRDLIKAMLKSLGYGEVVEAMHGGHAWEEMCSRRVDLLLTNWDMPVMSGLELVEKVRRDAEYDDLPVVLFTTRAGKEGVIEAIKAGVDAYMVKPFTPQELKAKIQSAQKKRSPQRQTNQILRGIARLDRQDDYPLAVFGEGASTPQQLSHPDNRKVRHFLARAVAVLASINARLPDLHLGYLLEGDTTDIARRLKEFGGRIKLLMLSAELPGDSVILVRLASINRRSDLRVILVCEGPGTIPPRVRAGLEQLGVALIERRQLDAEGLEQLFNEYFAAASPRVPGKLASPAEIRNRVENDIRSMVSLPVLPQVYNQITALDRDPQSDIRDWISAIEVDPLSRAQVIRRARSPLYGFRGEITDTGKAVMLLGKNAVKELIVAGAVKRSFAGVEGEDFKVEEYWLHSVAVAVTARLLNFPLDEARWTPEQKQDFDSFALDEATVGTLKKMDLHRGLSLAFHQDPFVGGMMHDIGKAVLATAYPGLFPLVVEHLSVQHWNIPMIAAEDTIAGGANHTVVGRILAQNWRLGEVLCQLVERHHSPAPEDRYAQLIALADFVGGGIYPYPRQAAYPMVRLSQKEVAGQADEKKEEGTAESNAQRFLPEGLLGQLGVDLGDFIGLGRAVAPAVRRLVGDLQKSI